MVVETLRGAASITPTELGPAGTHPSPVACPDVSVYRHRALSVWHRITRMSLSYLGFRRALNVMDCLA